MLHVCYEQIFCTRSIFFQASIFTVIAYLQLYLRTFSCTSSLPGVANLRGSFFVLKFKLYLCLTFNSHFNFGNGISTFSRVEALFQLHVQSSAFFINCNEWRVCCPHRLLVDDVDLSLRVTSLCAWTLAPSKDSKQLLGIYDRPRQVIKPSVVRVIFTKSLCNFSLHLHVCAYTIPWMFGILDYRTTCNVYFSMLFC